MHAAPMRMAYWDFDEDVDQSVALGMVVIGRLVREARIRRGLTQRQLAWRTGRSQSTISRLENGRLRGMRLRTLAAIIGVLRINAEGVDSPTWRAARTTMDEPPSARRRLPGASELAVQA